MEVLPFVQQLNLETGLGVESFVTGEARRDFWGGVRG